MSSSNDTAMNTSEELDLAQKKQYVKDEDGEYENTKGKDS